MIQLKNKKLKLTGLVIACALISACDRNFSNPVGEADKNYSSGTADFTTFVSVGDSLTAGYGNAALYIEGQEDSYPAILAQQFAKVGGGEFKQPLMADNLGGLLFGGNPSPDFPNRLVLNVETKTPEPIAGTPTTEVSSVLTGAFNNMGVPGAKSFHLVSNSYGDFNGLLTDPATANPYYVRFASTPTATIIGDAAAQQASFFVMWIGNNDVLSYATAGGVGVDQTGNPDPSTYGSTDITDPTAFEGVYSGLVDAMTASNPSNKGVLINIPDIKAIPYFTTVPYNALPLTQAEADALNAAYADYNTGVQGALGAGLIDQNEATLRTISFSQGQNPVVILDEDLTDITAVNAALVKMRQATANDLLVLTTRSKIGTLADPNNANSAWGVGVPLEDSDVLIPSEISAIDTARTAFNATIKAKADADDDLLFFDVEAVLDELSTTGIYYGSGSINARYATGDGFSLDGVHPTPRAYSIIANRIIKTINEGFNANIPTVNPDNYPTIFVK